MNVTTNRKITLSGEVNDYSVKTIYEFIISMNDEDYDLMSQGVTQLNPIRIYINSYGGYVSSALALIGVMADSVTPINTIALGSVMSSALPIYHMDDVHYSTQTALFLYHDVSPVMSGRAESLVQDLSYSVHLRKIMDSIIMQRSKIKQRQLDKVLTRKEDWIFGYEEALKLGVINKEYV